MTQYHKIYNVFKRDDKTHKLIEGEYSLPEFEFLRGNNWIATEKVDGTNIRIKFSSCDVGTELSFEGKTDKATIPTELLSKLNGIFTLDKMIQVFGDNVEDLNVCLYGEGYGGNIQKGKKYKENQDFVLFDVKIGSFWLKRNDICRIADKFNIDVVPELWHGNLESIVDFVKRGFNSKWGDFIAEGVVARPEIELKARNGARIITKIKHKDFLN
jgi:hypothetical protein